MRKTNFLEIQYKDFRISYGSHIDDNRDTGYLIEYGKKDENFFIEFLKDFMGLIPKIVKNLLP